MNKYNSSELLKNRGEEMDYCITIEQFEGPLDLLLHLIKESKVDIVDIKIEEVTSQYLDYIRKMDELNLDVASEYLVMASELIEIKSRMLLPKPKIEEEEMEEDPKERLISRLLEYQHYKEITKTFKEQEQIRKEIFTKIPEHLMDYKDEDTSIMEQGSLEDLTLALMKFLKRQKEQQPLFTKVTKKEISVEDRMHYIKSRLKEHKRIEFFSLFDILAKDYIVATFLGVLELAKQQELHIVQENNFAPIYCEVT